MNPQLIKKCLDELDKDSPRMDYIRGILETLYEMQTPTNASPTRLPINIIREPLKPLHDLSEEDILDKQTQERLKNIKDIVA